MPTEVSPAPFAYQQQYPRAMEHPRCFPATMPVHTPPHVGHLLKNGPGSILPNGLRNPWAPYAGETYRPAAQAANNIVSGSLGAGGGGVSIYTPRSLAGGLGPVGGFGGGGSIISSGYGAGLGGVRGDDGWDGSLGRNHDSHAPDMMSTAGALPRIGASASGWLQQPSRFQNHARMTPSIAPTAMVPAASVQIPQARHEGYLAPPNAGSLHRSHRSVPRSIPAEKCRCEECCEECRGKSEKVRGGHSHGHQHHSHGQRRAPLVPVINSPSRHSGDLMRRVSRKSRGSGDRSAEHCSECSSQSRYN